MHSEIYKDQLKNYVIFGAPLDIAFAFNAKFDFIIADKRDTPQPTTHEYKIKLIFGMQSLPLKIRFRHLNIFIIIFATEKFETISSQNFLIICDCIESISKIKTELEERKIAFVCVSPIKIDDELSSKNFIDFIFFLNLIC